MKPIKELLDAWTEKQSDSKASYLASNELVIQLWEALEWYSTQELFYGHADKTLNSIREKLEGTK